MCSKFNPQTIIAISRAIIGRDKQMPQAMALVDRNDYTQKPSHPIHYGLSASKS